MKPTFAQWPVSMPDINQLGSACSSASSQQYRFNTRGYGSHQAIAELVEPESFVLDVGCASGYLMQFLRETKGCRCVGIEINALGAAEARAADFHVIGADVGRGLQAVRSLMPFDYVIFGDVLEHLSNPHIALQQTLDMLSPRGHIIVSLPNVVSLGARIRLLRGIWRYEDMGIFDRTHLRFYSVETGRELLTRNGYCIEQERFVGPFTVYGGRHLQSITRLRPGILANQMVFRATPQAGVF